MSSGCADFSVKDAVMQLLGVDIVMVLGYFKDLASLQQLHSSSEERASHMMLYHAANAQQLTANSLGHLI